MNQVNTSWFRLSDKLNLKQGFVGLVQTQAKLEHFIFNVKPSLNVQYLTKLGSFTSRAFTLDGLSMSRMIFCPWSYLAGVCNLEILLEYALPWSQSILKSGSSKDVAAPQKKKHFTLSRVTHKPDRHLNSSKASLMILINLRSAPENAIRSSAKPMCVNWGSKHIGWDYEVSWVLCPFLENLERNLIPKTNSYGDEESPFL